MLKNALFFGKSWRIAAALGSALQPPILFRRLGALPPDLQVVIPTQFTYYFWALRRFLDIVETKITTYYLILEWQLVCPFAKLAPLAQTSSYVIVWKLKNNCWKVEK